MRRYVAAELTTRGTAFINTDMNNGSPLHLCPYTVEQSFSIVQIIIIDLKSLLISTPQIDPNLNKNGLQHPQILRPSTR